MAYTVDGNVHVLDADSQGNPVPPPNGKIPEWAQGATVELLLTHMKQAGIDHSVVVTPGSYDEDYCASAALRYPESFSLIGKVDIDDPDAPSNMLEITKRPEVIGVRFESRGSTSPAEWLDAPETLALWEVAAANDIGVGLAAVRKMEHLPALRRVLERYPNATVILRRMVQPPTEEGAPYKASENLLSLGEFPNVYSTFSHMNIKETNEGKSTHRAFFEAFLENFGAKRLIWSSFFPAYRATDEAPVKGLIDGVKDDLSFLSQEDRDSIFGGTARDLYLKNRVAA